MIYFFLLPWWPRASHEADSLLENNNNNNTGGYTTPPRNSHVNPLTFISMPDFFFVARSTGNFLLSRGNLLVHQHLILTLQLVINNIYLINTYLTRTLWCWHFSRFCFLLFCYSFQLNFLCLFVFYFFPTSLISLGHRSNLLWSLTTITWKILTRKSKFGLLI